MRLIDANDLMDVLKEEHDNVMQDPEVKSSVKWREAVVFHSVSQAIRHAPTVDAVEVVRCRDCKYFELNLFDGCEVCTHISGYVRPDFGCVDGERKNND